MKNFSAIIIGGTGQFGILMGRLLEKKNYKVFITSRNNKKRFYLKKYLKESNLIKLNIYNKKEIKKVISKLNPKLILYFAGQSSPQLSFKRKRETLRSNFYGCKNVLEVMRENNINCKFLNAASSEMYGHVKGKIRLSTPKNPLSPYGLAKKIFQFSKKI